MKGSVMDRYFSLKAMNTLIITSTVYVSSEYTVLNDPKVRLQQYVDCILFYLNIDQISNIIVCDNSDFDYSSVKKISGIISKSNKKVEFLYFKGDKKKVLRFGKGYGENEILGYVFQNSKLIKETDFYFKVTGRIIICNISSVLKKINRKKIYFMKVGFNPLKNMREIDTRFYYCSKDIYNKFLNDAGKRVFDQKNYFLEHAYYDCFKENKVKIRSFLILPKFIGISGSTGQSYKDISFIYKLKFIANLILWIRYLIS
jgi:hypothetical protein